LDWGNHVKLHLKKRIRNAAASFHPGEINYRLAIGEFGGFTVAYREGTADEKVIAHSFDNDIFFVDVPQYKPKSNDTVLDIGAHIGTFSLLSASKSPKGTVHAIEASKETYNYLRINTALNPRLNVVPHHLALTDRDGQVMLHHDRGNWGHSIMKQLSPRGETVSGMSLQSFVTANKIGKIAFIKFNCEGAEFPILMSAPPELLKNVNAMLVLYHLDLAPDYTLQALLKKLESAGFKNTVIEKRSTRGWIIAER
jgi:FkbM family methyltransferase